MAISDEGRAALTYWGVVQHAVQNKATTAELWEAIRQSAADQGWERPGVTLRGINEIRSMAAQTRNADTRLAQTDREAVLGTQHFSEAPWSRPPTDRNLSPMLQIRFEHHTIVDGELQTNWRTVIHSGILPSTVGDLYDLVDQSGEQLANDYEVDHAGYGQISVMSV